MVITGVVSNPGADEETVLSMQDAVGQGLLDLENGWYRNLTTGDKVSMIEAMNTGLIKVSWVTLLELSWSWSSISITLC